MPADTFNYDDLADLRYNSFTNEYSPKIIGYGSSSPEERTIPSTSPFIIKLFESPLQTVPLKTKITLKATGEILKEVAKGTTPANKQYAVNYDELGNGQVLFSSGQAGQVVYINYYGLGTIHQRSTLKLQIFGSASTKVVASSDSATGSQEIADEIILTTENAGSKINSIITELNAIGGGEIKILEGTYNCTTKILEKDNVSITGSGYSTIIKRNAAISTLIDCTSAINISINNLQIDGNKSSYTGVNYYGIEDDGDKSNRYFNLWVHDNEDAGLKFCANLNSVYSYNNGSGFETCFAISSCVAQNNTIYGFDTCNTLASCRAQGNTIGFKSCSDMSSVRSSQNSSHGFDGCVRISSSLANSNTGDGYNNTINIVGCYSSANTGNGFDNCSGMGFNVAAANGGSNYNNSYSDNGGTIAVQDTANGGFNG